MRLGQVFTRESAAARQRHRIGRQGGTGAYCALTAAALLAGCGTDESVDPADAVCTIAAEFQAELGHLDDPVSVVFQDDHRNVVRTLEGRWIVVGLTMPPPLLYAPDGTFEGTVGQVGDGPEEFLDPDRVVVDRTDSIWISDPGGRIVILDPRGNPARTIRSPGYVVDGFTPSNEPFSVLVRVLEERRPGESPDVRGAFPYVVVRSRDLDPKRGLGPGVEAPAAEGRTLRMTPWWGTIFVSDTVVLTRTVEDQERSWIDRWTPSGQDIWVTRRDIWRALGQDGEFEPSAIRNLSLVEDGEGGYWNLATARRLTEAEDLAPLGETPAPEEQPSEFASYLLHLSNDGRVTAVGEIPEADPYFEEPHLLDEAHVVSPWVHPETGLITLRIWRIRRDC